MVAILWACQHMNTQHTRKHAHTHRYQSWCGAGENGSLTGSHTLGLVPGAVGRSGGGAGGPVVDTWKLPQQHNSTVPHQTPDTWTTRVHARQGKATVATVVHLPGVPVIL
eukprot:scpid74544/ scgid25832/ 